MDTVALYDPNLAKMMVIEIPSICLIATEEGFAYSLEGVCKLNADYDLKEKQTKKEDAT